MVHFVKRLSCNIIGSVARVNDQNVYMRIDTWSPAQVYYSVE